jgi:hypothetical protein
VLLQATVACNNLCCAVADLEEQAAQMREVIRLRRVEVSNPAPQLVVQQLVKAELTANIADYTDRSGLGSKRIFIRVIRS